MARKHNQEYEKRLLLLLMHQAELIEGFRTPLFHLVARKLNWLCIKGILLALNGEYIELYIYIYIPVPNHF